MDQPLSPLTTTAELRAVGPVGDHVARLRGLEAALRRRDAILDVVCYAASRFLATEDWDADARELLARLGAAAEVSRAYLFEGYLDGSGVARRQIRHSWEGPAVTRLGPEERKLDSQLSAAEAETWQNLERGTALFGDPAQLTPSVRDFFARQGVRTFAAVPVISGATWWGYLCLADEAPDREWSASVIDALQAAAGTVGAAIYRMHRDRELRRRGAQLAQAQAIAHMGSWDWHIPTNSLTGSDEMYRIYGFEVGQPLTTGMILARIHPDDAVVLRAAIDGAVHEARDFELEHRIVRPSGEVRYVRSQGRVRCSADGSPERIVGAGHDITERRAEEERARQRDAELAEAQAVGHVGSFVWDFTTNELRGSDELYRIYGFDPSSPPGVQDVLARVHPEDAALVQSTIDDAFARAGELFVEHRIVLPTGEVRWFRVEGRASVDAQGRPSQLIGAGQDFTERREAEVIAGRLMAEQAARADAERARRRAELLAEASRILGTSFDYQTTLSQLARLVVPAAADFCTVDVLAADGEIERVGVAHVEPSKEALLWEALRRVQQGGVPLVPHLRRAVYEGASTLHRSVTPEQVDSVKFDDEQGRLLAALAPRSLLAVPLRAANRVIGAVVLYSSVSGREYEEADLRMAEELAGRAALAVENARLFGEAQAATRARDQMLGVVAHDLRNPLNTMLMASQVMEETLPPEAPARRQVAMVRRAGERMNRLIQDLLDVKRMEAGRLAVEPRPVRPDTLLAEAAEMMRPLAAASALDLRVEAADGLPRVAADPARVQQVLSNLVGNAIKFTPHGGLITLRAGRHDGEVLVTVRDTGPGIPPEQLPHIFGQFWQASKTDRRGIGLGLAIAKGIVEAHCGRIWVESAPGEGSSFYFTLPLAEGAAATPAART
ncbi:MAG: ATP-binding protein [Gemmatimonadaceae bacterium]